MKKNNAKKYLPLLLVVFIYLFLALPLTALAVNTIPASNDACDGKNFCLNVPIGTIKGFDISTQNNNSLGEYIATWYGFMLGAIGILATVMIMWGGFKYLTSRGDKAMIDSGKTIIISAITGLVLAFGTYTILNLINPALMNITMPNLPNIQGGENVNLGSYGKALAGEGTGTTPNTTSPQATQSNATIPCTDKDDKGNLDLSQAYTASYEGYRNTPYPDAGGQSIGYGHHYPTGQTPPQSITEEEALFIFNWDYSAARTTARSTFPNWGSLSQARQAVLVDLAYNMGPGVFSKFPNTTAAINSNNFTLAAENLLKSDYASQVPQRAANNAEILRNDNTTLFNNQSNPACQ